MFVKLFYVFSSLPIKFSGVKCNTKFQNARVNSICLEFSLAYIFALLIATPIALYNVHAADCLPVQIGVTNEKTRQSETFNI